MKSAFQVILATDLTRDAITAEIMIGDELWAVLVEVKPAGALMLETYSRSDGRPWALPLDLALEALAAARARLAAD